MAKTYATHVDLPSHVREQLVRTLNLGLANALDLYLQAKHAHWNAKGKHFLSRHELFDEVAEHLRKRSDEVAERLSTLGGYVEGTARLVARSSELAEHDLDATTADEHLTSLVHKFAKHSALLRKAIDQVRDLNDPATEDVLMKALREAEKDLWLLESHTHARPTAHVEEEIPTPSPGVPH
ncbi:MAG: DNA starvation/stationary phase protection protein Dps [Deltaproteobacteria bacterium]|nr:DNA starvation/stationary phase protection protein Dps [Deltaproteobacteria bacterium]